MSKELIKTYELRVYLGIFLLILGTVLSIYLTIELILCIEERDFQGWGMMNLNFLFFDIACIIFPGVCLIIINNKKKKKFFKKPEILDKDLAFLKSIIYHYLEENQNKAFTTKVLRENLVDKIEDQLLKIYFAKYTDKILSEMRIDGSIQIIDKSGESYYILS